jgi:uncharacterized protein
MEVYESRKEANVGSLRTIQGEANRLHSKERRDEENKILVMRSLDFAAALHQAVARNQVSQVTKLLEENGDLIATTDLAWTFNKALTGAIHMEHREMVKLLLRFADVNHLEEKTGKTSVIYAVMNGDPEMVKLLLDSGADPNRKKGRQKTALFHARKLKREQIINLLIAAGAKE